MFIFLFDYFDQHRLNLKCIWRLLVFGHPSVHISPCLAIPWIFSGTATAYLKGELKTFPTVQLYCKATMLQDIYNQKEKNIYNFCANTAKKKRYVELEKKNNCLFSCELYLQSTFSPLQTD